MSDPVYALFVSADDERCSEAVDALEEAGDGELRVAGATSIEAVREVLEETHIDVVVFGEDEDPLSPDGVQLLDVVELCTAPPTSGDESRTVPLVLFSDGTYPLSTAKATDGVSDYVRDEGEAAFSHLANRLRWLAGQDGEDSAYYKRIVEEMEDGVLTFDADGQIRYANEAMAEAFGLRQDAFEGTDPAELAEWGLVPEEGVRKLASAVQSILKGGAEVEAREVTITPSTEGVDHRVVEFHVVGMPGEASGAIASVRAVTEYKRMENALRTTSTKVERLPEAIEAIQSADDEADLLETTVTLVSKFLEADVAGIDTVEDGQFRPRITVGAEYGPSSATEGDDARAMRDGETVLTDSPGPEDAPLEDAGTQIAVPFEGVGLLRALSGGRISDRDRGLAETLVVVATETLSRFGAESSATDFRDRLRSLYENVSMPVASYAFEDGRAVVVAANSAFTETFGVEGSPSGTPLAECVRPADDADSTVEDVEKLLRSDAPVERTVRRKTVDGDRIFEVSAGPSAADAEDGYVVYRDRTDQRRIRRARQRQTDRLARIQSIVGDELRDQLNEARGYLELATETRDPEDMATVDQAHDRIERLIEDVNTLASQDPEVDVDPVDLQTVAARAWDRVDTGGASFDVEGGSLLADDDRLSGMLEQLFRNSLDHATPEGIAGNGAGTSTGLVVRVGPLPDGEGFYVEDTATTLPETLAGRSLDGDVATTVEEGESRLAAVQQAANDHGWSMRLEPNDHGGTRFEFLADDASGEA